jgi:hypothetical protein
MSSDELPDERAKLIAAARAAASWAKARRATWTDAPPAVPATVPEAGSAAVTFSPPPETTPPPPLPLPAATEDTGQSSGAGAAARARALLARAKRWLPLLVLAAALSAGGVAGARYVWQAAPTSKTRAAVVEPAPVPAQATPRRATGGLGVTSTPAGATVLVNGQPRGVTPLTLTDLPAGRYTIELKSTAGTVKRTVIVAADKTAQIDELIFSGWLAVYSPFEVAITEGQRALRLDDRNQIMLPPGPHELRLVNRALEYEVVRQVELKPGELVTLSLTPPPSTMTVTATELAEVWLDGARVGETPLHAMPIELGTHEIVVKRTAGGERRFTVAVTVSPFTLNVDFTKPAA